MTRSRGPSAPGATVLLPVGGPPARPPCLPVPSPRRPQPGDRPWSGTGLQVRGRPGPRGLLSVGISGGTSPRVEEGGAHSTWRPGSHLTPRVMASFWTVHVYPGKRIRAEGRCCRLGGLRRGLGPGLEGLPLGWARLPMEGEPRTCRAASELAACAVPSLRPSLVPVASRAPPRYPVVRWGTKGWRGHGSARVWLKPRSLGSFCPLPGRLPPPPASPWTPRFL